MLHHHFRIFNQELAVNNGREGLHVEAVVGDALLLVDEDLGVDLPETVHHLQSVREGAATAHQLGQLPGSLGGLLEADGGGEGAAGLDDHVVEEGAGGGRQEVEGGHVSPRAGA